MKNLYGLVAATGVLAIVMPGAASGAVTIGSDLNAGPPELTAGGTTVSQRNLLASHQAAGGLTSPINGVVVRWRVRAGTDSGRVMLRVIRPGADASEATGAGTSALRDPESNTTTSFILHPGLPIRVNDGIGLEGSSDLGLYLHSENGVGAINAWALPTLVDGAAPRAPSIEGGLEVLVQAVIEADKDGDKLGDESQDPDGGNPPAGPAPCTLLNLNVLNIKVGNLICL